MHTIYDVIDHLKLRKDKMEMGLYYQNESPEYLEFLIQTIDQIAQADCDALVSALNRAEELELFLELEKAKNNEQ